MRKIYKLAIATMMVALVFVSNEAVSRTDKNLKEIDRFTVIESPDPNVKTIIIKNENSGEIFTIDPRLMGKSHKQIVNPNFEDATNVNLNKDDEELGYGFCKSLCGDNHCAGKDTYPVYVCCDKDEDGNCLRYKKCKQDTVTCLDANSGDAYSATGSPYSCLECGESGGGEEEFKEGLGGGN